MLLEDLRLRPAVLLVRAVRKVECEPLLPSGPVRAPLLRQLLQAAPAVMVDFVESRVDDCHVAALYDHIATRAGLPLKRCQRPGSYGDADEIATAWSLSRCTAGGGAAELLLLGCSSTAHRAESGGQLAVSPPRRG